MWPKCESVRKLYCIMAWVLQFVFSIINFSFIVAVKNMFETYLNTTQTVFIFQWKCTKKYWKILKQN